MGKIDSDEAEFTIDYKVKKYSSLVIDVGKSSPLFSNQYDFFIIKNTNYYCISASDLLSLVKDKCAKKEKGDGEYQIRQGAKTLLKEKDLRNAGYTFEPIGSTHEFKG
jgi:hypothetical protein